MMFGSRHFGFFILICVLVVACNRSSNKNINWSENIAPIIFKNCSSCHRPNEAGGFNLLSYNDVIKKSSLIKFVTKTRYMPPWPADANYSHFVGERVLSKEEINLISDWIDNGMKRGDSLNEPNAPNYYTGSYFKKPDLIIKSSQPIAVKGNGSDAFFVLKFPYQIPNDTIVDFVEFVPNHRKLIHHVNGHLISYDEKRKFNQFAGELINKDVQGELMTIYKKMNLPYMDNLKPEFPTLTPNTIYYLPGFTPPVYPENIGGFRMKKNGLFLLNNLHFGPSNLDFLDSSYLNIFYRKSPITRPVREAQLGTFGISKIEPEFIIEPNIVKTFTTQLLLQNKISMLAVNPHMHLIGRKFWAFALKANGDTIPLIKINNWDFRWQYYYAFRKPVVLDAGTIIKVIGIFDNTSKNRNNPFFPPRTITQGNGIESMKTTEEMFQFIFNYLPYNEGDENINLEKSY